MSSSNGADDPSSTPVRRALPREEIRFGVILNGGVSLAVWMGGAVLELDRLTKAESERGTVYARLLRLAGCTARADVIAGTSAGGINGAALALSQVNKRAHLADLRDIWVDQGRIESLLRQPFQGAPTSLLRGDEFFLPRLNEALTRLAVPHDVRDADEAPVDLTITTTVLRGNQTVTVDSMGQRLPQALHAARFHWRRLPQVDSEDDPFSGGHIERTAHRLALASRCTASFPVAFEPVFVPVHSPAYAEPGDSAFLSEEQRLRPDMSCCVRDWGDHEGVRDRSRFVVDGGLLANTPTRAALEAVQAMPASGPVRRVMLLVYPHAPEPGADLPDTAADAPSVTATVSGLLGALTAQGGRTFVDELEHHNLVAAGRRGTRGDVLRSIDSPEDLDRLTVCLFPHFRRLRRWRAGRDLARRITESHPSAEPATDGGLPQGWSYERVRRAAEKAQVDWERRRAGTAPGAGGPGIPYVPDAPPSTSTPQPAEGWGWGVDGALGVSEGAADLLRRLIWVLPRGPAYDAVKQARADVSKLAALIAETREPVDGCWDENPVLIGLEPGETYWTLRLASYERLMVGTDDGELGRLVDAVADSEGRRERRRTGSPARGERRRGEVRAELTRVLVDEAGAAGGVGTALRAHVDAVVDRLADVIPILHSSTWSPPDLVTDDSLAELRAWDAALSVNLPVVDRQVLLTRLLQLEVASTTIGDEVSTGATLPVEIVQLSAQTRNAFTRYTRTGDDKLGGMSVNRFGGFLKRSWRVNDWIWGRIDAATILSRTVLEPQRVRRAAILSGRVRSADQAEPQARKVVEDLLKDFLPDEAGGDPRIADLAEKAVDELTDAFDPSVPAGDLPSAMPALADLFAWARQLEVVPGELPALAAAVRADGVEGANARSRGEVFLEEQAPLLRRIEGRAGSQISAGDRAEALSAFDRAGVGREPIKEEAGSDLTLRTATTAAAVGATVLDSSRSGLGAVRPVTRTLRGAMMLPYWVVTALTSRAALARALALLALSLGGVLLTLSLFGVLPSGLAGPAAAVGGSAVLVALAYGALRTGTLLHGLVLLTPVVPLVAYAAVRAQEESAAGVSTLQGISTLVVVVALSLALMLLGSLPASSGSVWSALDRLATRRGVPPASGPARGLRRGLKNAARRTSGLLLSFVRLLPVLVVVAVVAVIALWLVAEPWPRVLGFLRDNAAWLAAVAVALVLVGVLAAWRLGRLLQVLRQTGGGDGGVWEYSPLTHPAGASAGWAVLYGAMYLALAAFLVWDPMSWQETRWGAALLAVSIVLGVALALVFPLVAPFVALRRMEGREIVRARTVGPLLPPGDTDQGGTRSRHQRAFAVDLVARGVAYRWLVSDTPAGDGGPPSLTRWGTGLETRVSKARSAPGSEP